MLRSPSVAIDMVTENFLDRNIFLIDFSYDALELLGFVFVPAADWQNQTFVDTAWEDVEVASDFVTEGVQDVVVDHIDGSEAQLFICEDVHLWHIRIARGKGDPGDLCKHIHRPDAEGEQYACIAKGDRMQLADVDVPHFDVRIPYENAGVAKRIAFRLVIIDDCQIQEAEMGNVFQKLLVHLVVHQTADDALPCLFKICIEGEIAGLDCLILGMEAENFLCEAGKTGAIEVFLIIGIQVDGGSGVFSGEQDRHTVHRRQVYFLDRIDADDGLWVCVLPDFFRDHF